MDNRFVVIADDLTGANDTGIQFVKLGFTAATLLDPSMLREEAEYDVVVVDTESRNVNPDEARKLVKKAVFELLPLWGEAIFYKKVDSTLRGNIASELSALQELLNPSCVVFAPAYPKNGRTTKDGIHYLHGIPVDQTELAKDPRKPVTTSDLSELLASGGFSSRHLSLKAVREGSIPAVFAAAGGELCLSFDVEEDDDFTAIVNGVASAVDVERVLWVGSAGLAEALAARSSMGRCGCGGPALVVVGSASATSRSQLRKAASEGLVAVIVVDTAQALLRKEKELERACAQAVERLEEGKSVALASSLEERQWEASREAAASLAISMEEASERIAAFLADLAFSVLSKSRASGLFVTGGDIAVHVFGRLGAKGAVLLREIEPGIPLTTLLGGAYHGMPVITKAGAFGDENTLCRSVKLLVGQR